LASAKLFWKLAMKFFTDNILLFSVALSSGLMLLWPTLKGALAGGGALTANAAVQLINREKAVIVDVSEAEEFAAGHIGGAKNIPVNDIDARLENSVKNKALPLILVCTTGARASRVAAVAKKLGYSNTQVLAGGLKAWKDANLPIEKA
jgi:rhodanese-related sulfurtransferase